MQRGVVAALGLGSAAMVLVGPVSRAQAAPAQPYGNQDDFGWTDGQGVGASAGAPGTPAVVPVAHSAAGASPAPVCTYAPLSPADSAAADDMATQGWGPPKGSTPGGWYRKVCRIDAAGTTTGTVVWLQEATHQPPADPATLAQRALGFAPLSLPGIGLNPPAGRDQLVGVTTWLWVSGAWAQPVTASASAGGVTVTTTASPTEVVWDMGDGHQLTCAGPGTPYDPSRPDAQPSCSYTYAASSAGQPGGAYTLTATEYWSVSWRAAGVPAGAPAAGRLPALARTSRISVRVAEAQAINTGG